MADEQVAAILLAAQILARLVEQAGQLAVNVGIEGCRVDAFLVARTLDDVAAEEDRHRAQVVAGVFPLDAFPNCPLVFRIDVGMIEGNHQATGAPVDQGLGGGENTRLFRNMTDGAGFADFLGYRLDHAVIHQGPLAVAIGCRTKTFVAGGDNHADLGTVPLDDRVGADGVGKTDDVRVVKKIAQRYRESPRGFLDAFHETHRQVVRRGGRLDGPKLVTAGDEAVGKSAASVDIDRESHTRSLRCNCSGSSGCLVVCFVQPRPGGTPMAPYRTKVMSSS
ncbi:MAG: hypothetical protein NTY41_02335 [Proteobacteria bacterium]|nr:hypothetical protein [Pseudomonadota bacterium]